MITQEITSNEALIKWRVAGSNKDRLQNEKDTMTQRLDQLETDLVDWDGAKTLLELLKNFKLEKRKDFILNIINQAMADVFQEDYRIDILPKDMKGKSAASTQKYDIIFYHNGIETAKNDELLSSNGGGVLSIASLFFKLLIGYLYSKNKFYIFDESLSQVSPQYRERLSLFLKEFCTNYGFTLVIVSQTEELERHADIVYGVDSSIGKNKVPILKIDETYYAEGEPPKEDFFYSGIKNFQSIVNLDFRFKGFTIIRGPNNSGKSASLRAIDSVIFNNFKRDLYPRKNPGGKKLTTEVFFGFQGKAGTAPKEIGLTYKRDKVMFTIEGEEYFGKSLAADKLKEAVEDIGFKYIDVKASFKSFKGPLKDQTERIAFTSQHDGLFLIGAKTSDSEKIFSFLFNTENIALSIAEAKESLQELNKQHRDIQIVLTQTEDSLRKATLEVDYYIKIYYSTLIQEFTYTGEQKYMLAKTAEHVEELYTRINQFTQLSDGIDWLEQTSSSLANNSNKILHNNSQQNIIESLLEKIHNYTECEQLITLGNSRLHVRDRLNQIDKIIPLMENIQSIDYWVNVSDRMDSLKTSQLELMDQEKELSKEYQLQECSHCAGFGVEAC